jgi:hypothetical protein
MPIEKAFIQRGDHGELMSEPTYAFWSGARQYGLDIEFYTIPQIDELELTKETLVHGGVGMVRRAFERLGIEQPQVGGLPPEHLMPFYGRRLWATTMAEVRQGYEDNRFFFVKPLKRHKAFTGHVTRETVSALARTAYFDDSFEILASEVVYFAAEYRLFIHEEKILDARIYRGDFRKPLDWAVADRFVEAFTDAPVAYSLDLGLAEDGRTLVVEINDCFSLGSYGFPAMPYARMVMDRWAEIMGIEP